MKSAPNSLCPGGAYIAFHVCDPSTDTPLHPADLAEVPPPSGPSISWRTGENARRGPPSPLGEGWKDRGGAHARSENFPLRRGEGGPQGGG